MYWLLSDENIKKVLELYYVVIIFYGLFWGITVTLYIDAGYLKDFLEVTFICFFGFYMYSILAIYLLYSRRTKIILYISLVLIFMSLILFIVAVLNNMGFLPFILCIGLSVIILLDKLGYLEFLKNKFT